MKKLEDEAALQGIVTPAMRDWRVIVGLGLSQAAGCLLELKLTHDDGGKRVRKPAGSFVGYRRMVTVHGKTRGGVRRGIVACEIEGRPNWQPSSQRMAYSRVEEGQRSDLKRAGCFEGGNVRGAVIKPFVHKFNDSAVGYKPPDMVVLWGVRAGYLLGWSPKGKAGLARAYLIADGVLEERLATGRGSLSEAEAWGLCDAVLVWP